jgi:hypothetical protein
MFSAVVADVQIDRQPVEKFPAVHACEKDTAVVKERRWQMLNWQYGYNRLKPDRFRS